MNPFSVPQKVTTVEYFLPIKRPLLTPKTSLPHHPLHWKPRPPWIYTKRFALSPRGPACIYIKNADGEVIYVGKAKNLRSRVRSYLLEASQANAKTGSLMRDAVDVDYILVDNEHEALALENNLIKQRKPRFNILLRDDKTYPYVKLTLGDRWPKVFVTRRLRRDGSVYYGPYFPGNLAYRVVDLIHRSFLLPSCKVDLSRYHARPCLQYYIGRCLGPCVENLTTPEAYSEAVRDAQLFLEGRTADLNKSLQQRMAAAAANEQFELAAKYRDLLVTIDQLSEKAAHRLRRRRRCRRLRLPLRKRHDRRQPLPPARRQDRRSPRILLGRSGRLHHRPGRKLRRLIRGA
jgi:excinuclease UvrABC nuclease subunit